MNKKLRLIFFTAALATAGILIFQVYWTYNTYKTSLDNLNYFLTNALQSSIDNYQIEESTLPAFLTAKNPYLPVIINTKPGDSWLRERDTSHHLQEKHGKFSVEAYNLDSRNAAIVKLMLARLVAQQDAKPINLNAIAANFKDKLKKSNIDVDFSLVLLKHQVQLPKQKIAAFINLSTDNEVIEANLIHPETYLFRENITADLVSILLILLTGGSLYYMGLIIRRQLKLDDLKNSFINNMTHELRTPITILKSTHEALYHFGESADYQKTERYLKINSDILDKLDSNVDRILDIAQFESGAKIVKPELVDLQSLIESAVARFNLNEPKPVSFQFELNERSVITDGEIIETILSNLLDNAIKYSGENPCVEVKISSFKKGWQLQVKDKGKGIPEKDLPFVFDKFYRVSSDNIQDVRGYGIGLSFVKQLVALLNGKIAVKSIEGKGTVFTIQFPAL